jgi:hypothetical protein
LSNVRQIAVNQITGQSSLFEGAFQGVLHPQSLEGRWASMSPFGALVCLALLALPACRAQFFLADRYNGELTSGQLTVSPFSFTGVSLSPNQKCLSYESDGSSLVNLSPCSGSMDTSVLADKWAYNYTSNIIQSWGATGRAENAPLMCLDALDAESWPGSNFSRVYVRATPCTSSAFLQKWSWNGTTIKLAYADKWLAFKGEGEPFSDAAHAENFAFVIPLDDASGTSEDPLHS